MEDKRIVELYWERSDTAIAETEKKYGRYCHYIAFNILNSSLDAEECVNDTYVKAWEAMPPHKPERLGGFLGKLTRNIALNRYAESRAQKRSPHTADLVFEEAAGLIPDPDSLSAPSDTIVLKDAINSFLEALPRETRIIFLRRYWYMCSIRDIARSMGLTENNVKVILLRTRNRFKEYLEKEGITI
jgi:RNA polymerase sigma-70 factor (ECF subfamily)